MRLKNVIFLGFCWLFSECNYCIIKLFVVSIKYPICNMFSAQTNNVIHLTMISDCNSQKLFRSKYHFKNDHLNIIL